MTALLVILALVLIWNTVPFLILAALPKQVPWSHKLAAAKCFVGATLRGLLLIIPSFSAPIVVPIALLFTKREDNALPKLFQWWDNDVSINGDNGDYWPLTYTGDCYYAPGHSPRSFYARYVWLGFRNRASWLSRSLGHTWTPEAYHDAQSWGDVLTNRDHEGWVMNRRSNVYQIYIVKKLGRLCYRFNWGYKVWSGEGDHRITSSVINLTFSILSYEGK